MKWIDVKKSLPPFYTEVLVWIDGHRGPSWRNNHALVAYLNKDGKWFEERHSDKELIGVIKWTKIQNPK